MENQDHGKNDSSGHESHGNHVCRKCGWAFPNPHPSARHRRAHKRICGTIEGYKLLDSEETTHATVSDDEHLSDEEQKTPSPKKLERSNTEKSNGGFGERPNRSEDEVFSDAFAEFPDGGFKAGSVIDEHLGDARELQTNVEEVAKNDLKSAPSLKDGETDIIQPPSNATDSSQIQCPEVPESATNLFGGTLESQDHVSSSTEESAVMLSGNKNGSTCDLYPIKPETVGDASQENKKVNAGFDLTECSIINVGQVTGAKGNEESNLDRNLLDVVVSPSEHAGETSEAVYKSEGTEEITSDSVTADGVAQLKKDGDGLASKMSSSDLSPEAEPVEHMNASVDTAHIKIDAAKEIDVASSVQMFSSDLFPEVEPVEHMDASVDTAQIKMDAAKEIDVASSVQVSSSDLSPEVEPVEHMNASVDTAQIKMDSAKEIDVDSSVQVSSTDLSPEVEPVEHMDAPVDTAQIKMDAAKEIEVASSAKMSSSDLSAEVEPAEHNASFDTAQIKMDAAKEINVASSVDTAQIKMDAAKEIDVASSAKMSSSDLSAEVEPAEHNASFDTAQIKMDAAKEINVASSVQMSSCDHSPEVEPAEHMDAYVDTAQIKMDAAKEIDIASSVKMSSSDLSPEVEPVEHMNASVDTAQIKMDTAHEIDVASSVNSNEGHNRQEGDENVHVLSVPDDIPVVENAEIMLEGFKDHKGVKLHQLSLGSFEIRKVKEDDIKVPVPEESCTGFQSRQFSEDTGVSASDMHNLEANFKHEGGNSKPIVKEVCVEEEANLPQNKLTVSVGLDELGNSTEIDTIEMEKTYTISSHNEWKPHDLGNDSSKMSFPETSMQVLSDVNPIVAPMFAEVDQMTNLVDIDDAGNHEKAIIGTRDIAGNNDEKNVKKENFTDNTITTSESASNLSEFQVNPTTNILKGDDAGIQENGKIENCDGAGSESREEPAEENLPMKTKITPQSTSSLHESQLVAQDVKDVSKMKLPEATCTQLDRVSDTQEGIEQLEINGNNNLQGQCVGKVSVATESYSGEETSIVHMTKELPISPIDTESSIQSSAAVEDDRPREFGGVASGISSESLQGGSRKNVLKHEIGAFAIDVSVDSSSQTDSLEGNWGSVSVLSTQSDIPVVIDTETEKANFKKPKGASEGQHSEKSEIFEPPSFMTLVESEGSDKLQAAVSEIQAEKNPQQLQAASLQAGWFPSLTHVTNESQGRKKNEEIIAKVTNWSTGRQHTPLKSLLGEANAESKPKAPNPKENPAPVVQKDRMAARDSALVTTVSSVLGPQAPMAGTPKREAGKEWNSPARYPADIKREKRKVKGRPYWVQFVCCSSVN